MDRAPLHRRDRGQTPSSQDVSSTDVIESSGNLYQVALAALAVPPEADAQPTPKPHAGAAGRTKANVVVDSAHGGKGDQTVTIVEDDDAVTVRMENGKVASVERNGKKVPMDRVRQEDGKLKITDESGKVVYEMDLNAAPPPPPPPPPAPARGLLELRLDKPDAAPARPLAPGQLRIKGNKIENVPGGLTELTIDEAPKVIVGIQMAEPDRSLIGHFDLKPGEATMVSGIYENLPASIAGIDLYDIIIAIDGKSPAGQDDVRKALRSKKDGDIATFTVIHKGARNDVQLKLIPYAPDKLESAKLNAIPVETDIMQGMGGNGQFFVTPDSEQWRALTENPALQGKLDTKILEHLDRARNMSEEAGTRASEATKRRVERLRDVRPEASRAGQPPAPRMDGPAGGERVQNLEDRLDRLEKMLERLLDRQGGNNTPPAPGGRGGPRASGNES